MPTSDPIEILLAHDRWASQQILLACDALSSQQFHQRFDLGPGSLHNTITHILTAIRRCTDMLANHEVRPALEGARDAKQLSLLLDETAADLAQAAKSQPLKNLVFRERDGKLTPSPARQSSRMSPHTACTIVPSA
jgi:uncharacterized damage-inducible protein DinB